MVPGINRLIAADESLNHQIVDTFASVGTADHSWTEKIWFTLMRKDAKLQIELGIGKYPNRNILDGFAGIARGVEQRTVRASRELAPAFEDTSVGPIRYQVVEPFRKMRLTLAANDAQPLQFDLMFNDRLPPFLEGRDVQYEAGGRSSSDVVRYHQAGTVSGWVLINGERIEVNPDDWYGFRDHSWGTREHVGLDPADLAPNNHDLTKAGFHFNWFVSQIQRPDGSFYDLAYYFRESARGMEHFTGFINEADGTQIPVLQVYPEINYRARDHAPMSGQIHVVTGGRGRKVEERLFEIEAMDPDTGFRLHPALYFPWKGAVHGSWRGKLHVDGECIEDSDKITLEGNPAWQLRDRPMRIREGGNSGYADLESYVSGTWPAAKII